MTTRRKRKLGDVYAIPLPNGKYAFGRTFKEAGFGVYKTISDSIKDLPPEDDSYAFIISVYHDLLKDGEWVYIENRPFETEEDAWPPKRYIKDVINGSYRVTFQGKMLPSTEKECKGLERAAVWDRHHVVDRIMGSDKWN